MKFTYKLLSLGLAIACLSGCNAANTEIASSSAATATVDPATDSTEVPASNNVFTSAGDGLYVTTDSGIYELQTVFPDSANIFYTDANTKERIFLCANPNCTHADESCPSYIATPSAMFPPMLLRVGDQLLVVFTETTDSSNPHGMLMNMDGSNRRTVFELASNQYMMSLKYALTDKAKVSLKPEDGNSLFQILDNGLQISTGLTVLLGKRSSGKTYTLDQINAQFPGGKYIKQFSLLSTDDEQSQRKFEAALKNRGNSVTESYLGPFKAVVDDVQSVNLEQDAKEIDEYLETLKKAGEDAQRQDIFSKANLYQESNFSIKNLSSLVEMIEAVETLLGSIEYKELVEKYVGRRSLLRLAIALREQYIQEKTDSLHKEYVNSLITSVKKELSVRSSTTAVPDIDLYQILMNQHKVQVFHDVVKMIKKPRVIQAQNLYSYRVVAQSSPFSGALAMQKVSRSKTVFSDAFKEYNDPYKFLQVLKGKDIPASEYYKYFVNITYEVFNQYGSPASGGERSEYNLLQELSDGVKNSILILDEPESSFDNIFLRDGVDSLLKDISKTIPVIIATHNNTIGVSVHPDYIVYACKEVLSDGKLEYHLYSGYPSSEDLVDLKGNHISRKSVLLDCLEAGEAAYMDRRNSYEILNG